MGDFRWSYTAGYSFGAPEQDSLLELAHEISKLYPETAGIAATGGQVAQNELFLMSRGFHSFSGMHKIELPEPTPSELSLQSILKHRRSARTFGGPITLQQLATLLGQSLGATAIVEDQATGTRQALRSWPSAGGLYPLDAYIISLSTDSVVSGLYHYNPIQHELSLMSAGSPTELLRRAYFHQEYILSAAAVILLAASFDRTAAKYGDARAYRLTLLDTGHAAQNILLTASQEGLAAVAVQGYCDDILAEYLHLDGLREVVLHSIVIGAVK